MAITVKTSLSVIRFVIGVIILGIGCHACFRSAWDSTSQDSKTQYTCNQTASSLNQTCPPPGLEIFFLSISVITVVVSMGFTLISYAKSSDSLAQLEIVFQLGAALLLVIAGILVMVSAHQINALMQAVADKDQPYPWNIQIGRNKFQYHDEKIVGGALSILNGLLYGAAGVSGFNILWGGDDDDEPPLLFDSTN